MHAHPVTSQTAIECGFLRLPPKISEADWFGNIERTMRALLLMIKLTDLGIVVCSIAFSDAALDWGVQKLTTAPTAPPPPTTTDMATPGGCVQYMCAPELLQTLESHRFRFFGGEGVGGERLLIVHQKLNSPSPYAPPVHY
jgi:hypothetical protein